MTKVKADETTLALLRKAVSLALKRNTFPEEGTYSELETGVKDNLRYRLIYMNDSRIFHTKSPYVEVEQYKELNPPIGRWDMPDYVLSFSLKDLFS